MSRYVIKWSTAFRRDVRRMQKSGYNPLQLQEVVDMLIAQEELPASFRHHRLKGSLSEYYECHIRPDWLLIYKKNEERKILTMYRTGTHAQLFHE